MTIAKASFKFLAVLVFTLMSYVVVAEHHEEESAGGEINTPEKIKEYLKTLN